MTAANFQSWWAFCQQFDGSAHDDAIGAADAGDGAGTTVWGFIYPTWKLAQRYSGSSNLAQASFLSMTQAQAQALAKDYFWSRLGGNDLGPGIDLSVVDWAFNSGGAIVEIQLGLGFRGSACDGILGPQTLSRLIGLGNAAIPLIWQWRINYYNSCGFASEWPGLYTRADDCKTRGQQLAGTIKPGSSTPNLA